MPVKLTCSQGHAWEWTDDSSEDSTTPCPVCNEPVTLPLPAGTLPLSPWSPQPPPADTVPPHRRPPADEHVTAPYDPAVNHAAGVAAHEEAPGYELLGEIGR